MKKQLVALSAATALVAGPASLVAAGAASADPGDREKRGTCAGTAYEFSVDRDNGGYEVSADLDRATPGSRWTLSVTHDGQRLKSLSRTASADGDVELEAFGRDTAGSDTFVLKVKPAGSKACTSSIRFA